MQTFVEEGQALTLAVPNGGVVSGSAYLVGGLVVIAAQTAASGSFVGVPVGVFDVPKVEAEAWTEGEKIYFDANGSPDPVFTNVSGTLVGVAVSGFPRNLGLSSNADGNGLTIARNVITITDYSKLAGAEVTVTVDGVTTVLTEGSGLEWAAETANSNTATSLATAINALAGVTASPNSAVVTAQTGLGRVRLDGAVR